MEEPSSFSAPASLQGSTPTSAPVLPPISTTAQPLNDGRIDAAEKSPSRSRRLKSLIKGIKVSRVGSAKSFKSKVLSGGSTTTTKYHVKLGDDLVEIIHDYSGQQVISWAGELRVAGVDASFPPGSCNLYRFPDVQLRENPSFSNLFSSDQIAILKELILALALPLGGGEDILRMAKEKEESEAPGTASAADGESSLFLQKLDAVGASPVLGMLVANTAEAIEVVMAIFRALPKVLVEAHGPGPFLGENALHVLMVNRREKQLLELIDLASATFSRSMLRRLFCAQASGPFFNDPPMIYYGGTVVAYAVAFSMKKPFARILEHIVDNPKMQRLLSLNDSAHHACKLSGFLPLHVCVANGLTEMYDFLLSFDGLPKQAQLKLHHLRADPQALTARGRQCIELCSLSPLQLAVKMGNKRMFQHALKASCAIFWRWGPVTCYELDLSPIDSFNMGGNDVMELVGRLDASDGTKELLTEDFMQGFIHTLFKEKWSRYARYWYWGMRALDLLYFIMLIVLSFGLKFYPPTYTLYRVVPSMMLSFAAPIVFLEIRTAVLWLSNFRNRPESKLPSEETNQALEAAGRRVVKANAVVDAMHGLQKPGLSPARIAPLKDPATQVSSSEVRAQDEAASDNGGDTHKVLAPLRSRRASTTLQRAMTSSCSIATEAVNDTIQTVKTTAAGLGLRDDDIDDEQETIATTIAVSDAIMPLWRWIQQHQIHWKLAGMAIVAGVCISMICSDERVFDKGYGDEAVAAGLLNATQSESVRRLKGGGSSGGGITVSSSTIDPKASFHEYGTKKFFAAYEHLCVPLAWGVLLWSQAFIDAIFVPFRSAGVLWQTVRAMLKRDVTTWAVLFMVMFASFGLAMYISFPVTYYGWSTGKYSIEPVSKFNHPATAITSMLQLGLLGVELELDLVAIDEDSGGYTAHPFFVGGSTDAEWVAVCFFFMFYLVYLMMACIILLNLLIAMMSTTYATIMETATLAWRVDFARIVLKMELESGFMANPPSLCGHRLWTPWELHAGEKSGDKYVFYFRNVEANAEGYGTDGGKAVFDDLSQPRADKSSAHDAPTPPRPASPG